MQYSIQSWFKWSLFYLCFFGWYTEWKFSWKTIRFYSNDLRLKEQRDDRESMRSVAQVYKNVGYLTWQCTCNAWLHQQSALTIADNSTDVKSDEIDVITWLLCVKLVYFFTLQRSCLENSNYERKRYEHRLLFVGHCSKVLPSLILLGHC